MELTEQTLDRWMQLPCLESEASVVEPQTFIVFSGQQGGNSQGLKSTDFVFGECVPFVN